MPITSGTAFDTAAKMRDVVTLITRQVVEQVRPKITYGTVTAIDRTNKKASVTFPGESSIVSLSMNTLQPTSVGQVVRIAGDAGDRFLDEVIGPSGSAQLWGSSIQVGTAQDDASISQVNSYGGFPWYKGPRIRGANGFSIFVGSKATDVFGYRDHNTAVTTAKGYLWSNHRALFGSPPDDVTMALVPSDPLVVAGSFAGLTLFSRTNTKRYMLYANDNKFKLYCKTPTINADIHGILETGQAWFSRNSHGLDGNYDMGMSSITLMVAGNANTGGGAWDKQQLVVSNVDTNGEAGISFWCAANGIAPKIRAYGPFGEKIDFINSANTAGIEIRATAFTVTSTTRAKREVRPVAADQVGNGSWAKWADATKLVRIKRWKKLPTVHTDGAQHVCGVQCNKSPQNPCPIGFEDNRDQLGLTAEDVAAVFPEAVQYDEDNTTPAAIDYAKLTALLWEAMNELTVRVGALEVKPQR